jgi:hypothetical protein
VHEIDIPPEHQNDIKLDVDKSRKIKDDANRTQSCNVYFDILTTKKTTDPSAKPFDVHIV